MKFCLFVLFMISVAAAASAQPAIQPQPADLMRPGTGDWCDVAVQPLTATMKAEFVAYAIAEGKLEEQQYGVPGAVLAAMSIDESGYGRTRLAILANDVLSFKEPQNPAWRFGRPTFTLWCQPTSDQGNIYPLFGSKDAAFDYVAKTLAQRPDLPYAGFTKQYQMAIAAGEDRKQAAIEWLDRVAKVYTPTTSYVADVLRCAANPLGSGNPAPSLWDAVP